MPSKDHFHTYRRIRGEKSRRRYSCTDPECTHVQDKSVLVGKKAICPYCQDEYILDSKKLELALPHCGCGGKSKAVDLELTDIAETFKL
jgi:hypothetical protein